MRSKTGAVPGQRRATTGGADDARLAELGYNRVLWRRMSGFANFAISASIMAVVAGVANSIQLPMNAGGPRLMVFGWAGVGAMVMLVVLSMAEIASAYPVAGAGYYWADKLARKHGNFYSGLAGWLNFFGLLGGVAATDMAVTSFIGALVALQWNDTLTPAQLYVVYAAVLAIHAWLNACAPRTTDLLHKISVWWLVLGSAAIIVTLFTVPHQHANATFALTRFVNSTGFHSGLYVSAIGLLFAAWTFTGFDASAHTGEETENAQWSVPRGMVRAVAFTWILGLILTIAFTFSMIPDRYASEAAAPVAAAQIFLDQLGPTGAKLLLLVVTGAIFFCGIANVTAASRQTFAFSRDGAMPFSTWLRTVKGADGKGIPRNAVWLVCTLALLLALPSLWNSWAFPAVVSINVIGLFTSYGIPIALRLRLGRDFTPGPWNLGRKGPWIAGAATVWIAASCTAFLLPQTRPITIHNFNYAPVALAVVLLIAGGWWASPSRKYDGARNEITARQMAKAMEDIA
ncbi:amino acid permease [Catenulispora yoronensis]|uniref:Amino acid permease n=1 Tax=Catenulispora yoronensis TaxID=450799 RepID=A0ABP5H813_9ACTN